MFSDCCEELEIKGDNSRVFGQYRLENDTQISDIQYARIADEASNDTFILARHPLSGWKVRFHLFQIVKAIK